MEAKVNKRNTLRDNEVISQDNVSVMGERIALAALNTVLSHSFNRRLAKLYVCLNIDIAQKNNPEHILSDGYDLVQEAACFLCHYIGKRLDDNCGISVKGKKVTVLKACFSRINQVLMSERKDSYKTAPDNNPEVINLSIDFEDTIEKDEDYTVVDEIIQRMKLTPLQSETLEYLMNGMPLQHIAEIYNVMVSSIWFRREAIQKKYYKYIIM